jgi:hypothetical protein
MQDDLKYFIDDLITEIQEKYNDSLINRQGSSGSDADIAYEQGRNMAYYDVLDLIQSQMIAFGFRERLKRQIVPELGEPV